MENRKVSSTSIYGIDDSQILESRCFASGVPKHFPHREGKEITDADWPGLKSIIHRLYIIENLTFPKVKETLHLELGYNITKRQFTRKVEIWGFRKNFRKSEKDDIVKSGEIPQRFIHDSRINQKRIERLRKRNGVQMGPGVESEDGEIFFVQNQDVSQKTNAPKEASLDVESCYAMIGDQNTSLQNHDMIIKQTPISEFPHDIVTPNTEDQCSFGQSAEDDFEHPWLAELFVQLETAEIIASTSLDNETKQGVKETRNLSRIELKELSRPYSSTSPCGGSFLAQARSHTSHHHSARSTSLQSHNPGMHQLHWSPLFEIDIFPSSRSAGKRSQDSWVHLFASFERESIACREKLSKLERVLPANSPAIISTLECLTFVYHQLGKSREFEMTCRTLLYARQKEQCPNTYKMVEICLWIVDSYIVSHDLKIGMNLHTILHPMIENSIDSQHLLHIHSSYLRAEIFYRLCQYHEAEATIHPVMQIALASLGPSHQLTIRVMNLLCWILRKNGSLAEAEKLARYSLQVLDKSELVVTWLRSAETLMKILETRGLYNESANLCHHIFKLAIEAFDNTEYTYFLYHTTMARALLKQNEASKAVAILKGIRNSPYANGENKISIEVEFKVVLGSALWKQGSVWEAIVCFKESLKSTVKMYGWDHSIVFVHCKMIVNCLVQLLQYDEALKFFDRFLEKCRGFVKQGSSIAGWIEEIEDRMYKMQGESRDGDNSIPEDDYEEDETCFEDTEMKDNDTREEGYDDEARFEGRGPRLDDIFNTERDISKDITIEELGLESILA
ncbi:hypothetical protein BOTCAL_0223g00180 [Botryotinia calthae]|uniref:Clr5 domain-containing protein n=1 Tax=Botryotinia calthae TaxID=38488 RepID=A0A4Y8D0S0_9HELO|nr:hypothetical protein BOTCAL_0223g00180 [Botryotinia calthae]